MSLLDAVVDPLAACEQDARWRRRLECDADQIERSLPAGLWQLHRVVVERAKMSHAHSLILSGSTARRRRTEISDLDYHLIGRRIDTRDLSHELDLHVLSRQELESQLLAGDDFVQWSLRFGLVVFDDGTARRALRRIAQARLWPNVGRKHDHAAKSLELAERFVATGDQDGALLQVRTALSLAARARLLAAGISSPCLVQSCPIS